MSAFASFSRTDRLSEDHRADLHPDIAAHDGQAVTIKGWLHNRRSSGKIHFLILRDGTGFIQGVMSKAAVGEEVFKKADHLAQESAVDRAPARCAPTRARRAATNWTSARSTSSAPAEDYPITPKEHGVDFLMDRRHLWIRSPRQEAILRVRHEVINAVRDFFNGRGFILADTPIFTPAACEGTTTLFPVQYFEDRRRTSRRAASSTTKPTRWRSARSTASARRSAPRSRRRAVTSPSSGWSSPRWPTPTSTTSWSSPRAWSPRSSPACSTSGARELQVLERDTSKLETVTTPFPRITYDEAVEKLKAAGQEIEWGDDFGGADETVLSNSSTGRCACIATRPRSRRST